MVPPRASVWSLLARCTKKACREMSPWRDSCTLPATSAARTDTGRPWTVTAGPDPISLVVSSSAAWRPDRRAALADQLDRECQHQGARLRDWRVVRAVGDGPRVIAPVQRDVERRRSDVIVAALHRTSAKPGNIVPFMLAVTTGGAVVEHRDDGRPPPTQCRGEISHSGSAAASDRRARRLRAWARSLDGGLGGRHGGGAGTPGRWRRSRSSAGTAAMLTAARMLPRRSMPAQFVLPRAGAPCASQFLAEASRSRLPAPGPMAPDRRSRPPGLEPFLRPGDAGVEVLPLAVQEGASALRLHAVP